MPDAIKGPYWEPRDIWLGVYWDTNLCRCCWARLDVYVCVVPCFPVLLTWHRGRTVQEGRDDE